jgi:hypothetical protein
MTNIKEAKFFIYKREVYVIKLGPGYIWSTASSTKNDCIHKALVYFNVKSENFLKYKGAEIVRLYVKEIRAQESNSGNI